MNFDISSYGGLMQRHVDWLTASGVPMSAIIRPEPIRLARGVRAHDGRFENDANGPDWFVFAEPADVVFWRPGTVELATWDGRSFALGEAVIDNPCTFALGHFLVIYPDPLMWLRAERDGVVILNWQRAFDRLRDCPDILLDDESLEERYDRYMQPRRMPRVFVRRKRRGAVA